MKPHIVMAALALAMTPEVAASQSVAGRWRAIWDSAVRDDGRRVTRVVRRDTMELLIETRGDSLVATWRRPNALGATTSTGPGAGVTLHGRLTGDSLILTGTPRRTRRGPASGRCADRGRALGRPASTLARLARRVDS